MTTVATDDQLRDLIEKVNELNQRRNDLVDLLRHFPAVQMANTARIIGRLIEILAAVSAAFWEKLAAFIECDDTALAGMTIEELRHLLEAMIAGLELHLENAPDGPEKDEVRSALDQQLAPLRARLAATDDPAVAAGLLSQAKHLVEERYPEVLGVLGLLFSADFAKEIAAASDEAAEELASKKRGAAVKAALRSAILRFIRRKGGAAAARRAVPYVGVALTLGEAAAVGLLSERIDSIDEEACELMCRIVDEVIDRNWSWVDEPITVFCPRSEFSSDEWGNVTAAAKIYCHRITEEGTCQWDVIGCRIPFADGEWLKLFPIRGHSAEDYNPATGSYEWDIELDVDAANNAECLVGADKCALFIEVKTYFKGLGKPGRDGQPSLSLIGGKALSP